MIQNVLHGERDLCVRECMTFTTASLQPAAPCCNNKFRHEKYWLLLLLQVHKNF
jgi:hypothetical protein